MAFSRNPYLTWSPCTPLQDISPADIIPITSYGWWFCIYFLRLTQHLVSPLAFFKCSPCILTVKFKKICTQYFPKPKRVSVPFSSLWFLDIDILLSHFSHFSSFKMLGVLHLYMCPPLIDIADPCQVTCKSLLTACFFIAPIASVETLLPFNLQILLFSSLPPNLDPGQNVSLNINVISLFL